MVTATVNEFVIMELALLTKNIGTDHHGSYVEFYGTTQGEINKQGRKSSERRWRGENSL